jgi:hypothetical protein
MQWVLPTCGPGHSPKAGEEALLAARLAARQAAQEAASRPQQVRALGIKQVSQNPLFIPL